MMKAIYVESIGDNTAAIYVWLGKVWRLHAIINPDDPCGHAWPRKATADEMVCWRTNCTTHSVRISTAGAHASATKGRR